MNLKDRINRLIRRESIEPPRQETSTSWESVLNWAQTELTRLREVNDTLADADKTAHTRGRIKMLKDLIALPNKKSREKKSHDDE